MTSSDLPLPRKTSLIYRGDRTHADSGTFIRGDSGADSCGLMWTHADSAARAHADSGGCRGRVAPMAEDRPNGEWT